MRKKKCEGKDQIPITFPPFVSEESVKLWTSLKREYGDYLIFLLQEGLYFTIGMDACVAHQITGCPIHKGNYVVCYFQTQLLNEVFKRIADAGLRMAICDPPNQLEKHIFI